MGSICGRNLFLGRQIYPPPAPQHSLVYNQKCPQHKGCVHLCPQLLSTVLIVSLIPRNNVLARKTTYPLIFWKVLAPLLIKLIDRNGNGLSKMVIPVAAFPCDFKDL